MEAPDVAGLCHGRSVKCGFAKRRRQKFSFVEDEDLSQDCIAVARKEDSGSDLSKILKRKSTGVCTYLDQAHRKRQKQTNLLSFATSITVKKKSMRKDTPKTKDAKRGRKPNRREVRKGAFVQTYLDLGQRGFDLTECPICTMMYTPGIEEDERRHKTLCASFKKKAQGLGQSTLRADQCLK